MDALVLRAPNLFAVEDVPMPVPGRHEVLCKVHAVTICGTDIHIIRGDYPGFWPPSFPLIPGHEWAGEVVELGPESEAFGWKIGTRVAGTSHAGCGYCRNCVAGRYNLCENYGRQGIHRQYGHITQGSYAHYVTHSIKSVFPIPDNVSWEEGAMLDPTSIALHTVRRAGVTPGDTLVVIGPGALGLIVVQCALAVGAAEVIVVGRGERLQRAADFGAKTIDFTEEDTVARVRELTGGRGADCAIESSGDPTALGRCVNMLRKGGRVAVVGIPLEAATLPLKDIVLNEIDVVGVRANAGEMPEAIALVAKGRINLKQMITHRFPLRDYASAYRTLAERVNGALKVAVFPWGLAS